MLVRDNTSDNGGGAVGSVAGDLLITHSTIAGNQSSGGAAGVGNSGGSLTIVNSTISGNSGVGVESSALSGLPPTPATLTLSHVTVTGNSGDGVATTLAPAPITLERSLISGNGGNEINAASGTVITANRDNVIGFGGSARSTNFTPGATDVVPTVPVNAILDPTLQDNGGSTPTHALVTNSPAIDRATTGPATDQRGVSRPQGTAFDAGAFEVELVDSTSPVITPSVSGTLGNNGWYTSDVNVSWSVVDDESSISDQSGCDPQSVTSDTAGVTFTCSATSLGGSSSELVTIKRDATAPVVSVTGVSNGASYTVGSVPTAGCSTTDALSGVATQATVSVTGGGSPLGADGTGSFTATCSGATDNAGNSNNASVTYRVAYNWSGFLQPVDNLPVVNTVNAGQAIPVKFSLGGNYGLNIFATGYPASQQVSCGGGGGSTSPIEETATAGNSSLQYDPGTQRYSYVWKTDKAWAGTCRQLIVRLIDGTEQIALFQFNGKGRSGGESDTEGDAEVVRQQLFLPLVNNQ